MSEKTSERREAMFYKPKNGYDRLDSKELEAMTAHCEEYKNYLDNSKTEREAVSTTIILAEKNGFVPYTRDMELHPGMKVYRSNRGKAITLAVIGKKPMKEGMNIVAAHIDSPRLDLKHNPLYEDAEMAYFKTQYYGGIKKFQWLTIPLELRGVVALRDGTVVDVCIGEDEKDPIFNITDVLPHMGKDQAKKVLSEAVPGETLNILIGSQPDSEEGDDRVKLAILSILNEKYDIIEEDFLSAELCAVPAYNARDIGLDRSLIGSYGHDDRVCGYAGLKALMDLKNPDKTAVCILADKEEVGSMGTTGLQSQEFDCFVEDICANDGSALRECYENSFCLSADVCAGFDPNYADISDKRNSAWMNYGIGVVKYTGSRGKGGASDAGAEIIASLRGIFEDANVIWQMAELGKVDQGGGGTVAQYMANRNIDTIDAGVPVLSMHAPYEVVSKLDTYMTYKASKAVFEKR